jgi:hypothetical protein
MSKAPHKLSINGYRWAPTSFMGNVNMSLKDWEGPNAAIRAGHAKIMGFGLAVELPGWTPGVGDASCEAILMKLCDVKETPSGQSILLVDAEDGRWFECRLGNQWNDSSEEFAPAEHPLLINDGSPDHLYLDKQQIGTKSVFQTQGFMQGLLASYGEDQEDDHLLVTVHRHVKYTLASVNAHEVYGSLKDFVGKSCHDYSEVFARLRGDEKKLREVVSGMTKQFLKGKPEFQAKMKAENDFHGWDDSDDLTIDDCTVRVKILIELGSCCVVSKTTKTDWCVT